MDASYKECSLNEGVVGEVGMTLLRSVYTNIPHTEEEWAKRLPNKIEGSNQIHFHDTRLKCAIVEQGVVFYLITPSQVSIPEHTLSTEALFGQSASVR